MTPSQSACPPPTCRGPSVVSSTPSGSGAGKTARNLDQPIDSIYIGSIMRVWTRETNRGAEAMTTATAKTIKCALSIGTPTYYHRIDFEATGDRVRVTERTRDELCGNYNPHTGYTL